MRCETDDVNDDGYSECLDAFMIWIAPVCVGASTLLYGLVCLFLDDNDSHTFSPKALGAFFFLFLAVGWCAASLGSAGSGVSGAFFAFALSGVIALCFMVVGVFGVSGLEEQMQQSQVCCQPNNQDLDGTSRQRALCLRTQGLAFVNPARTPPFRRISLN